ncbi:hypothetical protein GLE_1866 [Lysobacter enzymogenes]|uniref:DUF4442 domain-containing protein n=1 Tax=Lysobacter enzymogenes TaxID=69 RepID=A0A0S2DFF2_LYSEN|nr:DUF4442 domain-containing protein [Lysobacter enzymogenes]ALN57218.1 hypothetical protein GLE_1866 [Lysobacter enzymogenes]
MRSWHERLLGDLSGSLRRLAFLPEAWRYRIVSTALGRQSRYFRTHRLRIVHIAPGRISIGAANHRSLRNRAGALHAMAASVAGEYAAALVVAQHLPRGARLLVKSVHADFRAPLRGDVQAQACIDPEQIGAACAGAGGRLRVAMKVIDATGKAPVRGHVDVVWSSPSSTQDTGP